MSSTMMKTTFLFFIIFLLLMFKGDNAQQKQNDASLSNILMNQNSQQTTTNSIKHETFFRNRKKIPLNQENKTDKNLVEEIVKQKQRISMKNGNNENNHKTNQQSLLPSLLFDNDNIEFNSDHDNNRNNDNQYAVTNIVQLSSKNGSNIDNHHFNQKSQQSQNSINIRIDYDDRQTTNGKQMNNNDDVISNQQNENQNGNNLIFDLNSFAINKTNDVNALIANISITNKMMMNMENPNEDEEHEQIEMHKEMIILCDELEQNQPSNENDDDGDDGANSLHSSASIHLNNLFSTSKMMLSKQQQQQHFQYSSWNKMKRMIIPLLNNENSTIMIISTRCKRQQQRMKTERKQVDITKTTKIRSSSSTLIQMKDHQPKGEKSALHKPIDFGSYSNLVSSYLQSTSNNNSISLQADAQQQQIHHQSEFHLNSNKNNSNLNVNYIPDGEKNLEHKKNIQQNSELPFVTEEKAIIKNKDVPENILHQSIQSSRQISSRIKRQSINQGNVNMFKQELNQNATKTTMMVTNLMIKTSSSNCSSVNSNPINNKDENIEYETKTTKLNQTKQIDETSPTFLMKHSKKAIKISTTTSKQIEQSLSTYSRLSSHRNSSPLLNENVTKDASYKTDSTYNSAATSSLLPIENSVEKDVKANTLRNKENGEKSQNCSSVATIVDGLPFVAESIHNDKKKNEIHHHRNYNHNNNNNEQQHSIETKLMIMINSTSIVPSTNRTNGIKFSLSAFPTNHNNIDNNNNNMNGKHNFKSIIPFNDNNATTILATTETNPMDIIVPTTTPSSTTTAIIKQFKGIVFQDGLTVNNKTMDKKETTMANSTFDPFIDEIIDRIVDTIQTTTTTTTLPMYSSAFENVNFNESSLLQAVHPLNFHRHQQKQNETVNNTNSNMNHVKSSIERQSPPPPMVTTTGNKFHQQTSTPSVVDQQFLKKISYSNEKNQVPNGTFSVGQNYIASIVNGTTVNSNNSSTIIGTNLHYNLNQSQLSTRNARTCVQCMSLTEGSSTNNNNNKSIANNVTPAYQQQSMLSNKTFFANHNNIQQNDLEQATSTTSSSNLNEPIANNNNHSQIAIISSKTNQQYCPSENDQNHGDIIWPMTDSGILSVQPCPTETYYGTMFRMCQNDAIWLKPDMTECRLIKLKELHYLVNQHSRKHLVDGLFILIVELKNLLNKQIMYSWLDEKDSFVLLNAILHHMTEHKIRFDRFDQNQQQSMVHFIQSVIIITDRLLERINHNTKNNNESSLMIVNELIQLITSVRLLMDNVLRAFILGCQDGAVQHLTELLNGRPLFPLTKNLGVHLRYQKHGQNESKLITLVKSNQTLHYNSVCQAFMDVSGSTSNLEKTPQPESIKDIDSGLQPPSTIGLNGVNELDVGITEIWLTNIFDHNGQQRQSTMKMSHQILSISLVPAVSIPVNFEVAPCFEVLFHLEQTIPTNTKQQQFTKKNCNNKSVVQNEEKEETNFSNNKQQIEPQTTKHNSNMDTKLLDGKMETTTNGHHQEYNNNNNNNVEWLFANNNNTAQQQFNEIQCVRLMIISHRKQQPVWNTLDSSGCRTATFNGSYVRCLCNEPGLIAAMQMTASVDLFGSVGRSMNDDDEVGVDIESELDQLNGGNNSKHTPHNVARIIRSSGFHLATGTMAPSSHHIVYDIVLYTSFISSVIFFSLTLIVQYRLRHFETRETFFIIRNLIIALLLIQLTFLLGTTIHMDLFWIRVEQLSPDFQQTSFSNQVKHILCLSVPIFLHFIHLASMFWMLSHTILLYQRMWRRCKLPNNNHNNQGQNTTSNDKPKRQHLLMKSKPQQNDKMNLNELGAFSHEYRKRFLKKLKKNNNQPSMELTQHFDQKYEPVKQKRGQSNHFSILKFIKRKLFNQPPPMKQANSYISNNHLSKIQVPTKRSSNFDQPNAKTSLQSETRDELKREENIKLASSSSSSWRHNENGCCGCFGDIRLSIIINYYHRFLGWLVNFFCATMVTWSCTHYLCLSLGFPFIFVLISYWLNSKGYETKRYCWMSIEGGIQYSFIMPVLLLISLNTCLILLVLKRYFEHKPSASTSAASLSSNGSFHHRLGSHHHHHHHHHRHHHHHHQQHQILRPSIRACIILLPFFCLNWFLGVLSLETLRTTPFELIFAITNGSHSFLAFYFHCYQRYNLKYYLLQYGVRCSKRWPSNINNNSNNQKNKHNNRKLIKFLNKYSNHLTEWLLGSSNDDDYGEHGHQESDILFENYGDEEKVPFDDGQTIHHEQISQKLNTAAGTSPKIINPIDCNGQSYSCCNKNCSFVHCSLPVQKTGDIALSASSSILNRSLGDHHHQSTASSNALRMSHYAHCYICPQQQQQPINNNENNNAKNNGPNVDDDGAGGGGGENLWNSASNLFQESLLLQQQQNQMQQNSEFYDEHHLHHLSSSEGSVPYHGSDVEPYNQHDEDDPHHHYHHYHGLNLQKHFIQHHQSMTTNEDYPTTTSVPYSTDNNNSSCCCSSIHVERRKLMEKHFKMNIDANHRTEMDIMQANHNKMEPSMKNELICLHNNSSVYVLHDDSIQQQDQMKSLLGEISTNTTAVNPSSTESEQLCDSCLTNMIMVNDAGHLDSNHHHHIAYMNSIGHHHDYYFPLQPPPSTATSQPRPLTQTNRIVDTNRINDTKSQPSKIDFSMVSLNDGHDDRTKNDANRIISTLPPLVVDPMVDAMDDEDDEDLIIIEIEDDDDDDDEDDDDSDDLEESDYDHDL